MWSYSTVWANEILQIVNLIGLYSYNLLIITLSLFYNNYFKISRIRKLLISVFVLFFILVLFLYGDFKINKNKKLLEENNNKVFVKIISPNFELKYNLDLNEIEERLRKIIKYSEPDKTKQTLFIWPEGAL